MTRGSAGSGKETVLVGRVLTPEGLMEDGIVVVSGGIIRSVEQRGGFRGAIDIDAGDRLIAPGFIDIHVHGAVGHSFMKSSQGEMASALAHHLRHGTTGLLATTTTASGADISRALSAIREAMQRQDHSAAAEAVILGVHVEGPYLSGKQAGAQNPQWLRQPNLEEFRAWESLAPIRMMTIAPELPGAESVIRHAREQGSILISAGHTNATLAEMEQAVEWGVTHCTHFGNGMRGLHHREPGVMGAGLMLEGLTVELIADGIHVHPAMLQFIHRIKGTERTALITDAVAYCGMPDGVYPSHEEGREVIVADGSVRLAGTGGLAGSCLTMNRAAKQMARLGIPLPDVCRMASAVPARLLGIDHRKGNLRAGMDADLIVIDKEFEVHAAMVSGEVFRWTV